MTQTTDFDTNKLANQVSVLRSLLPLHQHKSSRQVTFQIFRTETTQVLFRGSKIHSKTNIGIDERLVYYKILATKNVRLD